MNYFLLAQTFFMSCILCAIGFTEEPSPSMTLKECQSAALQQSERLSIADIQTLIEREKIREIKSRNNPKILAEGTVTRRDKHPGSDSPSDIMRNSKKGSRSRDEADDFPERIKTISGRKAENNSKISLIVPLFDSGLVSNRAMSQEYVVEASEQNRARVEQTLLNEVAQSYFALLESQKLQVVVLQSIETLKRQKETSEDLFSVGLITKHDLLVVDVQLYERQQELIQTQNNEETAKASLNRFMGRDLETPLSIVDVPEEPVTDDSYFILKKKSDFCHPDVKKIEAKQQALPYEYKSLRAELLPQLNAFVDYNNSSAAFILHRNWLTGGLHLSIPIFDGGVVESQMKQKKEEMSAADLLLKKTKEDIHLDIKRAYLRRDACFHKIPVAQKSVQEAEDNLRMSSEQYQEGLLSCDDLMNDETRLSQAKANYYRALYQWHMAESELQYAAGVIQPE